jgi:hypothetical protein
MDQRELQNDLDAIKDADQTFVGLRAHFVALAQDKGGAYAFEVLKRAVLPPNIDLHLMGHAIGDELYKQEGLDGIAYCTQDFRNACSHSIVVGALLADGLGVLDTVNAVCKKAPGGPGAYTMCFHGFGHGVLAYTNYEVPDAVKICEKVGTEEYHNEESDQCISGIVMEMHDGFNDPTVWEEKKDKYLSPDDPLKLCKADYMPESAKYLCYSYITPYIFDAAGAIANNPRPEIYPKSFSFCDTVEDERLRNACYGGLGKEFVVLAQDRDIRRMEDMTNDRLELAESWCLMGKEGEAQQSCLLSILDSLYWGGENDPEVSVRYCSLLESSEYKNACFTHLYEITTYYQRNPKIRENICSMVPDAYKKQCSDTLL